jgi:hypothetical protein
VGLLYPNDATGRGEGSISYLVRPKAGLASGTVIENRARIVFDYNGPIDTPLVRNTLDAAYPSASATSLATTSNGSFLVNWSGSDESGGSGVATYDVYRSVDGEPFALWLDNTTQTSAEFTGEGGRTYDFYTIAIDNVGHRQNVPAAAQTSTTILNQAPNFVPGLNQSATDESGPFTFTAWATALSPGPAHELARR